MIESRALALFLSGRAIGFALLLAFQVLVVRVLPTAPYARYALVIGLASLAQTLTSVGLPRVAAKFLSDQGLAGADGRRLAAAMLGARVGLTLAISTAFGVGLRLLAPADALFWPGAAYAFASALQIDADGMAQALGLQTASRQSAIGEPALRLIGAGALIFTAGVRSAEGLLWISAATACLSALRLIMAVFDRLPAGDGERLDWGAVRRVAVGGYGGTLSWLAFSPGVVRVIGSRVLPAPVFAGFAFVQTLVVSLQRYAPSFILFPLLEPRLMARGRSPDRLRAALSLLVKIDAGVIGAAIIGVSAAGAGMVLVLTQGRYGMAAAFLPWLLLGVVANASHRSYEVAAIALGAAESLTRALGLTLVWLGIAVVAAPRWGVWPLLLCPLGDAVTRLWLIERTLARQDRHAGSMIDIGGLAAIGLAVGAISIAGAALVKAVHAGLALQLLIGALLALAFLAVLLRWPPLGTPERAMVVEVAPAVRRWLRPAARRPLRVWVLTPRGRGGPGGVDRLMDSLRPLMAARPHMDVRFLATRGRRKVMSPIVTLFAAARLAAACALGGCDVIHVNLGADGSFYRKYLLLAAPRLLSKPYVLHLHGSGFADFWDRAPGVARRRIDGLFSGAAQVIVLSEGWRAALAQRRPQAPVIVLPNAAASCSRAPAADLPVQLLFLGELSPRKGAHVLVEALGRLATRTPWRAVIAGDGDAAPLRRRAVALGLGDQVSFPGWLGAEAVQQRLALAHILVLPSFEETLPMAVIEAFAAGLAVIATPVGALPEIITSGETGLLAPPGDHAALAQAMQRLIDSPTLRQELGAAALALHSRKFHILPYADRLTALWRRAASIKSQEEDCLICN